MLRMSYLGSTYGNCQDAVETRIFWAYFEGYWSRLHGHPRRYTHGNYGAPWAAGWTAADNRLRFELN